MHFAKGHIAVDERWRFELAVAAAYRAFAPRAPERLAAAPADRPAAQGSDSFRAISYYSYRYL